MSPQRFRLGRSRDCHWCWPTPQKNSMSICCLCCCLFAGPVRRTKAGWFLKASRNILCITNLYVIYTVTACDLRICLWILGFLKSRFDSLNWLFCLQKIQHRNVMKVKSDLKKFLRAEKMKLDPRFISLPRFQIVTDVDGQRDGCVRVG